uniref:C2H2-type domain-containing protein n=1 Tax=Glossina brevipalpis TaxID=37001 RepID=A0A1A9WL18_9MUSC
MAFFSLNVCRFNGCGIVFPSLRDLIIHIENTHIDYDPKIIEEKERSKPECSSLSYVSSFTSQNERMMLSTFPTDNIEPKHQDFSSNQSSTIGDEIWYSSKLSEFEVNEEYANLKPYPCPIAGCKKRYKNINGIRYHSKNGHKNDGMQSILPLASSSPLSKSNVSNCCGGSADRSGLLQHMLNSNDTNGGQQHSTFAINTYKQRVVRTTIHIEKSEISSSTESLISVEDC